VHLCACGEAQGSRKILLSASIFIDATDFKEQDASDYYGLAPGKLVRVQTSILKHYAVVCKCSVLVLSTIKADRIGGVVANLPLERKLRAKCLSLQVVYQRTFTSSACAGGT
jgi:hypothetical protein